MYCVKGSLVQKGQGLFRVDYRFLQSLRHGKPCHLPLHKGGNCINCINSSKYIYKSKKVWYNNYAKQT